MEFFEFTYIYVCVGNVEQLVAQRTLEKQLARSLRVGTYFVSPENSVIALSYTTIYPFTSYEEPELFFFYFFEKVECFWRVNISFY